MTVFSEFLVPSQQITEAKNLDTTGFAIGVKSDGGLVDCSITLHMHIHI